MYQELFGIILFVIFIIIIHYVMKTNKIKNKPNKIINKSNKIKNKSNNIKNKSNNIKNKIKSNKIDKQNTKLMNNITKNNISNVYIEIEENGKILGRIVIKLFDKITPKTAKNFKELCILKKYITAPFHRIIKDFMLQSGDFTNYDGTGGVSIYGRTFPDENFKLEHDRKYLLSMANSGPNTNGSQFFITTSKCPHLDGKHVVFGEVMDGFDLVDYLNEIETNREDKPRNMIIISDCGIC